MKTPIKSYNLRERYAKTLNRVGLASTASMAFIIAYTIFLVFLFIFFEYKISLRSGPSSDVVFINFLEVIYFIANSFVAIAAILALIYAKSQFEQAREQN